LSASEYRLSEADWFTASLEEYKTLREESQAALDRQLSIVRFGVLVVGTLIGLGLKTRHDAFIGALVLTVFVPMSVYLVLSMYLAEVERSVRAGAVVAAIECKLGLSSSHERPPIGWERWLRGLTPTWTSGDEGTSRAPSGPEKKQRVEGDEDAQQHQDRAKDVPKAKQRVALLRVIGTFGLFLLPAIVAGFLGNYTLATCEPGDLPPSAHCYPIGSTIAIVGDCLALVLLLFLLYRGYNWVQKMRKPPAVDAVWPQLERVKTTSGP